MILPLHEQLKARVRAVLAERYDVSDPGFHLPVETPPNRTMGDLGTPVAFDLARRLRKAPRVIAQEIADALGPLPGITRVEAAPNGYLNVFLDRPAFLLARLGIAGTLPAAPVRTDKTIVEHTAINRAEIDAINRENRRLRLVMVTAGEGRGAPIETLVPLDEIVRDRLNAVTTIASVSSAEKNGNAPSSAAHRRRMLSSLSLTTIALPASSLLFILKS